MSAAEGRRVTAALAALMTALMLQGALIGPLTMTAPVSLPAVLVAAVALANGPATGMSFGFTTGIVADLGSSHPAGALALSWLGLGVVCGLAADRRSVRGDVVIATILCAGAALFAGVLLALVHGGLAAWPAPPDLFKAGLGDALLALGVIPVVRRVLRTEALHARPAPATGFDLGSPRG